VAGEAFDMPLSSDPDWGIVPWLTFRGSFPVSVGESGPGFH